MCGARCPWGKVPRPNGGGGGGGGNPHARGGRGQSGKRKPTDPSINSGKDDGTGPSYVYKNKNK